MSSIVSYRPGARWFRSDEIFNSLYPISARQLAQRHWTPLRIARMAADFLAPQPEVRVLDIGSGIGKFCLAAAFIKPSAFFYGIEQRANLVKMAADAQAQLKLDNAGFMHGNFTSINFNDYDHFYFFNSFYENLSVENKIDDSIDYTEGLYNYYCGCLYQKLSDMRPGTRIVTFHSLEDEIPYSYTAVETKLNNKLKYWIKD